ncbi:MAG: DNA primase family protein [Acidimicrobiales bacterium]
MAPARWSKTIDEVAAEVHADVGDLKASVGSVGWDKALEDGAARAALKDGDGAHPVDPGHLTDVGNSERLIARYGDDFRYVASWAAWLVWDGKRWKRDAKGEVYEAAKAVAANLWIQVATETDPDRRKALARWASQSEGANRIEAMIKLARTAPEIVVDTDELDADPWLFNVVNGTVDLRGGPVRPHRREDLITKLAPVAYRASRGECPTWLAFLERVLPDPEVRDFLQEAVGYSLTGTVTEHLLFFAYGTGANGKTTLLQTLLGLFGEHGRQADPDLLLAAREAHPTGVADLLGARLVVSTEIDEGRRLAEATVKRLSGGDRLKARYMRQDFFEFEPTHTLFLAANHRPIVRGTDAAIWRRLRLIPFNVSIDPADQDHELVDKLRKELTGILSWALEGCRRWQAQGMSTPTAVMVATDEYRTEMDVLGNFLAECCVVLTDSFVASADLYRAYVSWCEANGERPASQRKVGLTLTERGFERRQAGHERRWHWFGLGLLANVRTDPTLVSV